MRIIRYKDYDGKKFFATKSHISIRMKEQGFTMWTLSIKKDEKPKKLVEDFVRKLIEEKVFRDNILVVYRTTGKFNDIVEVYIKQILKGE